MTDQVLRTAHAFEHSTRPGVISWAAGALSAWRSRRQLATLDDRMLDDIGVSRSQAIHEATRPVWDVPAHWVDNG